MTIDLITILGPTATGKTRLAACLANEIGGEIICADSRQVYRGMSLGTGKDLNDYVVNGKTIPYHLIDIVDAGYEYNVFEYVNDFHKALNKIKENNKVPILCGGSGMYIEAVLKGYDLQYTPIDTNIRGKLESKTDEELIELLKSHRSLHNVTDTKDRARLIRAIEIETTKGMSSLKGMTSLIIGVHFERDEIRQRITSRLKARLNSGMVDEVKKLMDKGISEAKLKYYGLEYKYIAMYLNKEMKYDEMFEKLNTAIHQYAKRQMTWFRRMERNGFKISWIDGKLEMKEKVNLIVKSLSL